MSVRHPRQCIAIDAADREWIFKAFTRLHTRAEFAGTGIGLAICKKIVQLYDGRIWVEAAQGAGSTSQLLAAGSAYLHRQSTLEAAESSRRSFRAHSTIRRKWVSTFAAFCSSLGSII